MITTWPRTDDIDSDNIYSDDSDSFNPASRLNAYEKACLDEPLVFEDYEDFEACEQ